jgi:hypothetical protein
MNSDLISDIRDFLSETGMGPSYFGKVACGNSEVVSRLENGRTITLETAEKIRAYMISERRSRPAPKSGEAA